MNVYGQEKTRLTNVGCDISCEKGKPAKVPLKENQTEENYLDKYGEYPEQLYGSGQVSHDPDRLA